MGPLPCLFALAAIEGRPQHLHPGCCLQSLTLWPCFPPAAPPFFPGTCRLVYLYRQPTPEQQLRVGREWVEESAKIAVGLAEKVLGVAVPPPRSSDK